MRNFEAMIVAQGKRGRQSHQQDETKHLHYFVGTLSALVIQLTTVNLVFIYVPAFKHWLEIKVVNMLSRGEILRWVLSTPMQFITVWQFYTASYETWNCFFIDMDVLVALKANIIYFCSVYSVLRAIFSSDFLGMDFFGSSLMFLALSLLGRYADALVERNRSRVITKHNKDMGYRDALVGSETGKKIYYPIESDEMGIGSAKESADTVSKFFMILGISFSLLIWLAWYLVTKFNVYAESLIPHSMNRSQLATQVCMSVMSISSSCSLPLATRIVFMVATQAGASFGVLFRSVKALEDLHKVNRIVFNKRSLTIGNPEVFEIKLLKDIQLEEFIELVAAVEANSSHPLAKAITEYAKKRREEDTENSLWPDTHDFISIPGRGVKAIVQSKEIFVGNRMLMDEHKIAIPDAAKKMLVEIKEPDQTLILVAINREITGIVAISDPLNPVARQVISVLKSMKITSILVTGDNSETANCVAREVGIEFETENVIAEVKPDQKVEKVKNLLGQGYVVAMVDCGTSNSLAIETADVGISIGAGTGIAKEAAHILLKNNNLQDVITALDLSKKTSFRNGLNCSYVTFHNTFGVPIVSLAPYLLGFPLQPWIAGTIATASSLVLVVLSYLLKNYTRPKQLNNFEIHGIRVE